jgi:tripartite-type tricarboxylate transporter receptor subunit TctC
MEMFAQANGLKMLHVPYEGSGDTVTALLGGQLQAGFRALPVSSATRIPAFPEIPS